MKYCRVFERGVTRSDLCYGKINLMAETSPAGKRRGGDSTGGLKGGREGELGRKAVPRSARVGGTLVGSQVQRSAGM